MRAVERGFADRFFVRFTRDLAAMIPVHPASQQWHGRAWGVTDTFAVILSRFRTIGTKGGQRGGESHRV